MFDQLHNVNLLPHRIQLRPYLHAHTIGSPQILLMLPQSQFVEPLYREVPPFLAVHVFAQFDFAKTAAREEALF